MGYPLALTHRVLDLIGAVSVLANAWVPRPRADRVPHSFCTLKSWSPLQVLRHCLIHTQCKVIIVDAERADRLEPIVSDFTKEAGTTGVLAIEAHEGKGHWNGVRSWDDALDEYRGPLIAVTDDPGVVPEDNASILFTSGALDNMRFAPAPHAIQGQLDCQKVFSVPSGNGSAMS